MTKKVLTLFFTILLLFISLVITSLSTYSQSEIEGTKVLYMLPYPGLLPDSPLYPLKTLRDHIIDAATRDSLQKAKLYLQLADKRAAMALALSQKNKSKLAIDTYTKGEKYLLKIPGLLAQSKKQGVSPQSEFINTLKLSTAKHREVGEILLKQLSQGDVAGIQQAMKINSDTQTQLNKW